MHECAKCGKEFDSEKGLKVHSRQMHPDEDPEELETKKEAQVGNITLRFNIRQALVIAFAIGVLTGGFTTSAALAAGGITGMIATEAPTQNAGENDAANDQATVDVSKIDTEGQPVMGDPDAPVTVVMYEDWQCPFCQRHAQQVHPKIVENYVKTGDVKLVWKDFALPQLGHDWAEPAAAAAECVYRQDNDAFWTVEKKIFDNQKGLSASGVQDQIMDWAAQEGVDRSAVQQCLENGNPMEAVNADKQEGQSFDTKVGGRSFIGGTPSFVVYADGDEIGEPLVGAQPYSRFASVIDSKLS